MVQIIVSLMSGIGNIPEELLPYGDYIVISTLIMSCFVINFVLRLFGLVAGLISDKN